MFIFLACCTITCDALTLTSLFAPLLPLYMVFQLDNYGIASLISFYTWCLSFLYHNSQETQYTSWEPLVVHFMFVCINVYFYSFIEWNLFTWLCLLGLVFCYWKGSGRGAREGLPRKQNYVIYHSWFHIIGSLYLVVGLWSSVFVLKN